MATATKGFDGPLGKASAVVMARMNRDMEIAAVDALDLQPHASVLAIGFGPGVGVEELARRLPEVHVCGIDPSAVMVAHATRRNRAGADAGRVMLRRAGAESIPWPDDSFDAVVAVNSAQLWHPLDTGLAEVARVLRAHGSLVMITHRWAIERRCSPDAWVTDVAQCLALHGIETASSTKPFRSGPGIVVTARRRAGPPTTAPGA